MLNDPDWSTAARVIRERREARNLRQADLAALGGPSLGTVQNIEQASRQKYARRTFGQIERALWWTDGAFERVLSGTATEDDLNPRHAVPPGPAHTGGSLRGGGSGVMTVVNIADTVGVVDNATASYGPDVLALARATYQIEQAIAELAGCERTPRVAAAMGALTRARRLTLAEQVTPGDDV